jgi:hypothetical protein
VNSRSSSVLAVVGVIAVTVLGCTTALIITGHVSPDSWPSVIAGIVSPIVLTILGVQNSQQSQAQDVIIDKVSAIDDKVNGRMSELITRNSQEGTQDAPDGSHGG